MGVCENSGRHAHLKPAEARNKVEAMMTAFKGRGGFYIPTWSKTIKERIGPRSARNHTHSRTDKPPSLKREMAQLGCGGSPEKEASSVEEETEVPYA